MRLKNTWLSNNKGMAMIIVLTASFVVLVTIGVGAAMIAGNLDKIASGINRNKVDSNLQIAYEKLRGIYKVDNSFLGSCATGDCISLENSNCISCTDPTAIYTSGDLKYKIRINSITQPSLLGPSAGSAVLDATGYYRNLAKSRSYSMCLNYCAVATRNCGDNGCGGVCGTCIGPQTCGGGGTAGVCGSASLCANDITVECDGSCVEGEICGGGRVIDSVNRMVAIGGGCEDEAGTNCGVGNPDSLVKYWDTVTGTTGATDPDDGSRNAETLRILGGGETILPQYEAVKFCDELVSNNFENWYLPATNELALMYTAYTNTWLADFAALPYWSSTEVASKQADQVNFNDGTPLVGDKDQQFHIRCIRRY